MSYSDSGKGGGRTPGYVQGGYAPYTPYAGESDNIGYDWSGYAPGAGSDGQTGRVLGTMLGTMLGTAATGNVAAGVGLGSMTNKSLSEGWMGDAFNTRKNEHMRDALEDTGISRGDTALAQKHGILESEYSSLLDESSDDDGGYDPAEHGFT